MKGIKLECYLDKICGIIAGPYLDGLKKIASDFRVVSSVVIKAGNQIFITSHSTTETKITLHKLAAFSAWRLHSYYNILSLHLAGLQIRHRAAGEV